MKILCGGDLHLTDSRPANRVDNYWETCKRKANFIFDTATEEDVDVILFPGDMTDTPALSYFEFTELVTIFKQVKQQCYTCFGQHDMRYRTKKNTALSALAEALRNIHIIDKEKCSDETGIIIKGSAYGEDIPLPEEGKFNVLIIHRMIIEEKLWSAQELYEPSNIFLRQNKYDLIVSGDNHSGFISPAAGSKRLLINCGSMMRSSIAQVNHRPFIVIFDTETRKYKQVFIPIEPADKVFRMERVETEKARNENLESFVSGLSSQKEIGLLFEDNLLAFAEENGIEQDILNIIYDSFGKRQVQENI